MSEVSPPPRPTREYKIGDVVPMVKPKLVIRPAPVAVLPNSPSAAFTRGRSRTI